MAKQKKAAVAKTESPAVSKANAKAGEKSRDAIKARHVADLAVQKAREDELGPVEKAQRKADIAAAEEREAMDAARIEKDREAMARKLDRELEEEESVRHINGDLNDRSPDNLELRSPEIDAQEKALGRAMNKAEMADYELERKKK